jgi:hypothetical protein
VQMMRDDGAWGDGTSGDGNWGGGQMAPS